MDCESSPEIELTEEQLEKIAETFGEEKAQRLAKIKFIKIDSFFGLELRN